MRLLNIVVIGALILAATYVYSIKFESTLQGERVAKLRGQLQAERNAIAMLRAEWARLDTPARIEELARRHLPLRRIEAHQFDNFDRLPDRAPASDGIGAMLDPPREAPTGSVPPAPARR